MVDSSHPAPNIRITGRKGAVGRNPRGRPVERHRRAHNVSRHPGPRAERIYLGLVADYQAAILNFLYRLVGSADQAEDLTQETFLRAYRALGRLELSDEAAPRRRAWLYRIAHNVATDHLRRRSRMAWLPLDVPGLSGGRSPEGEVAAGDPVRRAMDALPAEQQTVLLLFSNDGLEAREVAAVLGISPAAARKRRQRAREAFMAAYDRETRGGP